MTVGSSLRERRYHRYFTDLSRFYQKKQVRVYTEIVLTLLTIIFFLVFAIRPTLITVAGLIKEIKEKRVIAEKLDQKINDLSLAQKEYQRIQKDLYLLDEALPLDSRLTVLVRQLEALARKDGAEILSLQFEKTKLKSENAVKPAQADEAYAINFSIGVTGDYFQLKSFLYSLAQLRRITLTDSFLLQAKGKDEKLFLTLNGKASYLAPDGKNPELSATKINE